MFPSFTEIQLALDGVSCLYGYGAGAIIAIVGAVISAISSAYTIHQTNEAAEDQVEHAERSAAIDKMILATRQQEVSDQESLDRFERVRQGERERAAKISTASQSGFFGKSLLRELQSSYMQEAYDINITEHGSLSPKMQASNRMMSVEADKASRIGQANAMKKTGLMAGLQIGSDALSGASSGYSIGSSFDKPKKGE